MSVKSADFDDVYDVSGQSHMFKSIKSEIPQEKSMKQRPIKEQPHLSDYDHAMIEDSSNSMVNMAISLDPLSAENALRRVEREILAKQKKAI